MQQTKYNQCFKMFRLILVSSLVVCCLGANLPFRTGLDNRIVGGHDTKIEDNPFQVSLQYGNRHNCGGSLIGKTWVLTAAHCISGSNYNVWIGSADVQQGGTVHPVKKSYVHPNYSYLDYDFGLLELEKPVELNSKVQLVKLAADGEELADGTMLNVTGWGDTKSSQGSPRTLQLVTVPLVNQEVCNKAYSGDVTDRMLCAGYMGVGGKDACQGDSGGPVVSKGVLYGIVSWGRGCAEPNYPGVYTKVSADRKWIKKVSGI